MADVARLAQVSPQTVSRVLNDYAFIRPDARDRVLQAIDVLDYRPNLAARTLATSRSRTIGVVATDYLSYGPAAALWGVERAAGEAGYGVSIVSLRESNHRAFTDALQRLVGQSVEGIVLIAPQDQAAHEVFDAYGGYRDRLVRRLTERGVMPETRPEDFELIARPVDYLGLNVYSRVVASAADAEQRWWVAGDAHPGGNFLDNGMEFYPKSVYDAIRMVTGEYGFDRPLYVTENGVSEALGDDAAHPIDDAERIRYVAGFLSWIAKAVEEGADVRGYYLWSLMDNYEWSAGFSQRFGLYHLDTRTLARMPKRSAHWYRDIIAARGFDPAALP